MFANRRDQSVAPDVEATAHHRTDIDRRIGGPAAQQESRALGMREDAVREQTRQPTAGRQIGSP